MAVGRLWRVMARGIVHISPATIFRFLDVFSSVTDQTRLRLVSKQMAPKKNVKRVSVEDHRFLREVPEVIKIKTAIIPHR